MKSSVAPVAALRTGEVGALLGGVDSSSAGGDAALALALLEPNIFDLSHDAMADGGGGEAKGK